jgi:hypothetical protein
VIHTPDARDPCACLNADRLDRSLRLTVAETPLSAVFRGGQSSWPRILLCLGANRMKKIAFVLAAAGLMSVAACNKSPEAAAVENNAELVADNMEMTADNMEVLADNSTNAAAADVLENVADNMNAAADNVRDAADEKADNM